LRNIAEDNVVARSMIWRMYRDAGDHDYLLARFSARSNLLYQFWWNAQQAVEKYLKAALMLNGRPVNKYGHKLVEMFNEAQGFSDGLLPVLHCPPRCVIPNHWPVYNTRGFLPVAKFVEMLETNGDPNNRYRTFSIVTRPIHLFYFDELCFSLRRIAFPLDMKYSDGRTTVREELLEHRTVQLHERMGFEQNLESKHSDVWNDHYRWCNFAYFYGEALEKAEYPSWGGAINAEPFLTLSAPSKQGIEALSWIAENGFPKSIGKSIQSEIQKIS